MSKRDIRFAGKGWEDYLFWHKQNKKMLNKIHRLILEIQRDPYHGTGKPEALKENYTGFWSRRIDKEHRIVYAVTDNEVSVVACRFHYAKD